MGAQLNIKGEHAYRLAARLPALTGESLTAAVTEALRMELDREPRLSDKAALQARLLALADDISADRQPGISSGHDGWYDHKIGRPRRFLLARPSLPSYFGTPTASAMWTRCWRRRNAGCPSPIGWRSR